MTFDLCTIDWVAISAILTFFVIIVALLPILLERLRNKREANDLRYRTIPFLNDLIISINVVIKEPEKYKSKILNYVKYHQDTFKNIEIIFHTSSGKLTLSEQLIIGHFIVIKDYLLMSYSYQEKLKLLEKMLEGIDLLYKEYINRGLKLTEMRGEALKFEV